MRLLKIAFQLFHEQGFHATGVATIVREAGVNPGSMYHFFASKDELLLGVLEFALDYLGVAVMNPVEAVAADPIERIDVLLSQYRSRMEATSCRMGCPMGNLALEVSDGNPQARELIHRNFENWAARVESWLEAAGDRLPPNTDKSRLARFVLTVMEGGLMQSRAAGHLGPFDEAVAVLQEHIGMLMQKALPPQAKMQRSKLAKSRAVKAKVSKVKAVKTQLVKTKTAKIKVAKAKTPNTRTRQTQQGKTKAQLAQRRKPK
jgi:TetR/AcrR family transcriptional regulator, transcriptional repressor for nem operon